MGKTKTEKVAIKAYCKSFMQHKSMDDPIHFCKICPLN